MYIIRSVRYLILRKDGKKVAFVTYGPFGKNRIMDVPLDCVSKLLKSLIIYQILTALKKTFLPIHFR